MKSICLFIADDHAILRESLQNSLLNHPAVGIIETFEDGEQLLIAMKSKSPDVVLLDINMPKIDGLTACKEIKEMYPKVKVVFLSMHNSPQYFYQAKAVNCDGYILKTSGLEEIRNSIVKIQSGEKYFSPLVIETLLSADGVEKNKKTVLTERENEILKLILNELSNKEIAETLHISLRTVDAHKRNLLAKTNSRNLTSLIKYAMNEHLIK